MAALLAGTSRRAACVTDSLQSVRAVTQQEPSEALLEHYYLNQESWNMSGNVLKALVTQTSRSGSSLEYALFLPTSFRSSLKWPSDSL